MPWLLLTAYILVALGLGFMLNLLLTLRRLQARHRELEAKLEQLKQFSDYCLTHASHVLADWLDYRESNGKD